MKLTYEFKQGDCVDCTNLTDEQVQSILDRMWELGASKWEGLNGRWGAFQILKWSFIDSGTFFDDAFRSIYNQITWEEIMKHEQVAIDWQNIYYKLEGSDRVMERVKELANKMSKASGCVVESCITDAPLSYESFLVCNDCTVKPMGSYFVKNFVKNPNQKVTEQQLDARIKEMSESFSELVESGKYKEEDMENCKTYAEECCEGGSISAGCYHDNCEGGKRTNNIPHVTEWKCFREVADVLGEDNAEYELGKVRLNIAETGGHLKTDEDIAGSFDWGHSPQGLSFWSSINLGELPENYHRNPDVLPTPEHDKPTNSSQLATEVLAESLGVSEKEVVSTFKNSPNKSIGELIERVYVNMIPTGVCITLQGDGTILLHGENVPTVDVSKLEAEGVDKAYEAMVMLEGCFVGYGESEGE